MLIQYCPLFILLIICNIFTATCQEKGSLTYVIDNTRSMRHDIEQVKESADAITKIVFEEKASQIKNMILVTFNDPHAKLEIDTESREEFKRHINNITVSNPYGNWDCEEPSLKGLLMGLEKSRAGSFIYAFTDASAKDFWKSREIKNLCQKKQSQITFVLTGHCYGRLDKGFQVYYDIATACSGLAFYVSKHDVDKVLATIKESVSGNKTVITSVKAPAGKYTNIPFVIDDQTEYAIITASGSFVSLNVTGPRAVQEKVMWIRNAKVIKLSDPTPGKYIARVRGQTETSVHIVGRTDFLFNHGFSALEPKSISDTTPQPIANAETHLLIAVTDPKHTVNIISAQVLNMDENVRFDLTLRKVSKDFYTTGPFIAPGKRFKVAVSGKAVRDSKVIRRIAKIPITPQDPPKPKSKKSVVTISEGNTTEVEYGSTVKLTCRVSAYPEPKITWNTTNGTKLISQNSAFELPYEYISYLTIKDVLKRETFTCWGKNDKGMDSKKIEVIVKEPFKVKTAVKGTTTFKYNEKATLSCDITASVPMHIIWTYEDKSGTSKNIVKSNKYQLSEDGKQLNINKMDLDMVGKYSCKAILDGDPKKFVVFSTQVEISGLMQPKINGQLNKTASKGSNVVIECRITGVPKPTISWQFMAKGASKFSPIPGSDDVLSIPNVDEKHAGSYKCVAHNVVGRDEYITTLTVQVLPTITGATVETKPLKGSNVTIECHVSGIPKPTITWQFMAKNGTKFVSISGSENELRVYNIGEEHAGRYKCVASNVLGTSEHVTTLTVYVPPIVTGASAKTARNGSNVVIDCNVHGIPQPIIIWQFKAEGDSKFVTIPGSDDMLNISSVDVKHAGSYKCVAHNIAGDAEHATVLTVQVFPEVTGIASQVSSKGLNVDILCHVFGIPKPTISWQFLSKNDLDWRSISGSNNVLHISNVDDDKAGSYKCIAHNALGTAEHVTKLTVEVPPTVSGLSVRIIKEGSTIDIKCHVYGIPQPTIRWQFLAKDDKKFVSIPGSDNMLLISSVEEKHAGRYKCVANNLLGTTEFVTTLVVLSQPKVTGLAIKTTPKGSNVDIECYVTGVPRPAVKWQFMAKNASKFVSVPGSNNVLHISNVDETQAGSYKCVANNSVGVAEHITRLTVQVPPKVIDVPAETTPQKGSDVIIDCHATGIPKPTVTWQFKAEGDSKFVTIAGSDDVLSISSVDEKHAGSYKCVAHNVLGDVEHVTTLSVQVAPKVTGIGAQTTTKGSNVFIECNVSGAPQPTITWQFMSELGTSFVPITGSDKVLTVPNVDENQAGRYKCVAHNIVGEAEHITTLTVQVLPKLINVAAETTSQKGSNVDIKCHVTGIPKPTITWQFKAEGDSKYVTIPGSDDVLSISTVDEKHAGSYKCVAHNVLGDVEHVTTLNVQVAPKVTGVGAQTTTKGSNVFIECNVSGAPQPTITWQFKSEHSTSFVPITGSDKVLTVPNVDENQAGRYKCVAHNIVGEAEHITSLTVQVLPKLINVAADATSQKGSNVDIKCHVTGIPKPTITWQFKDEGDSKFVTIPGSDDVLSIPSVDEKHAGSYKCVAHNVLGDVEHVTTLNVQVAPNVTGVGAQTTTKGSNVFIECNVSGAPQPTITWQFMSELGTSFLPITGSDKVLTVPNVDENQAGRYKCVAHNIVGEAEHITTLTVQVLPKLINVAAETTSQKGSNVDIKCHVTGIPKPTITWQFKAEGDSKYVTIPGSDDVLSISTVDEKHAGSYKCVAHNVLGDVEHVTTLNVQVAPKVTGVGAQTTTKGSNVFIECNVSGAPQPIITWQFMSEHSTRFVPIAGSDKVLTLPNVDENQAGRYKCIAHNIVGEAEHIITLTVQVLPKLINVAADATSQKGSNVDIKCHVTGIPKPTITWQFKDEGDSKFVTIPGSDDVLSIPSVDEKHAGSYKCVAHNVLGDVEHVTTLNVQVAPNVTGIGAQTTIKGSNVVIDCNVSGAPQPTITWQFMSEHSTRFVPIAGSDKVLTVPNVDENQAGRYKCVGHNIVGEAEHIITLTVQVLPKLINVAAETTSQKGSNVDIKCHVTGIPKPTIAWQFKGEGNSNFVTIPGSDDVLSIPSVDEKHAGSYKCVAHNVLGDVEHVTTLNVQVAPKVTGIGAQTTTKGSKVFIECNVSGAPQPTITWQFKSELGTSFVPITGSDKVLTVPNVDGNQAGRYKCVAHNIVGEAEHITTLTVQVLPKFDDVATKATHQKGSNVDIKCHVTGTPKPTITWQFKAEGDSNFATIPGSDDVLSISSVDEKHAGSYKCVAHNVLGDVEHVTKLTVEDLPKILSNTSIIYDGVEGRDAQLKIPCTATGLPKPTIIWKVNGAVIRQNEKYSIEDGALLIKNPLVNDSQTYTCEVINDLGSDKATFQANVFQVPKVSSGEITKKVIKGSPVTIECQIDNGIPKPSITWLFMGAHDIKFVPLSQTDYAMRLWDIDVKHAGQYKCIARNVVGVAEHITTLIVEEAPEVTGIREMVVHAGASVDIECKVIKGIPAPNITWQFKGKRDSNFNSMPGTEKVLHISGVQKMYTGSYKCIAQNTAGTAEHITTLNVEFVPIIMSKTNITYEGLEGDVALRIPCNVVGAPKPTITWKIAGAKVIPNDRISIMDGSLVIKEPKESDTNSYTCEAKNDLGTVNKTFTAEIHTVLGDSDKIEEVNILTGTTKKLECGSNDPTKRVRWFKEFEKIATDNKFIYLKNVDFYTTGNYSCRVSDMNGAHTITYEVIVGTKPVFIFEQEDPIFDWQGSDSETDLLDCQADAIPPVDIEWTYNGKVLEGKHISYVSVDGNWGHYTCNVSNVHGAAQKSFDVISSYCFIKRKPTDGHITPLILSQNFTWPVLNSRTDYLAFEPGLSMTFFCPNQNGVKNSFRILPTLNEISARCDKQDIFIVNDKPYKISDLDCSNEIEATVTKTHEKCLTDTTELIRVGYDVHGFLQTYEVCFDTSKNIPLYTHVVMSKSNQGREVTQSWYTYPGIGTGKSVESYTCVDDKTLCCYGKRQLVNARDVSDGPAQRSTFIDPLNAIPYWRPCKDEDVWFDPWDHVENMIRMQFGMYSEFDAWSGIHSLQEKNGLAIPRFLWKVVKFDKEDSIAIIHVNDQSFSTDDILCKNICFDYNVPWILELDKRTYCCNVDEFLESFGLRHTNIGEATTYPLIDIRVNEA